MLNSFQTGRISRFGRGGAILRSPSPLEDEQIMRAAPSVFANAKHDSRSERYTYIPTSEVLRGLRAEGFQPFEVRQGGSRDDEKRGFTKHMVRLRREGERVVGDSFRELILLNSHDGTSSYQLMSGIFRLVCSNGMVVADGDAKSIRVPHKGDVVGQVIDAAYEVIADADKVDARIDAMRTIELRPGEQEAFASAAAELRFAEGKAPVSASTINRPRRSADAGADLWRTFNRAQENLTRGGLHYVQLDERGRPVARRETRPVNSIDGNVSLNRALWVLAAKMAELKA